MFDRYRVEELRAGCRAATHCGEIDVPSGRRGGPVVSDRERAAMFAVSASRSYPREAGRSGNSPDQPRKFEIADRYVAVVDVEGAECGPTGR